MTARDGADQAREAADQAHDSADQANDLAGPAHDPADGVHESAAHESADRTHDSAGLTWQGRELGSTDFKGDHGASDVALSAALDGDDAALARAVADARLIVPVVAEPVALESFGGTPVEKQTSLAMVTLVAPDGQRALPVFTSVASLGLWDPSARPVPVSAHRAAQAAVSEGCDAMVLDVAGPVTRTLRSSLVWALAQRREWVAPDQDPVVAHRVRRAVQAEDAVVDHTLSADEPGTLAVALTLVPGLTESQVQQVVRRLGERLAADGEFRVRIDGLAFTLR
jgi:hypothetical protein